MSCLLWILSSPGTQIVPGFQLLLGLRRMEESDWMSIFHNQTTISYQKPCSSYFYLIFLSWETSQHVALKRAAWRGTWCSLHHSAATSRGHTPTLLTVFSVPDPPRVSASQEILVHSLLFQVKAVFILFPLPPSSPSFLPLYLSAFHFHE